MYCFGTLENPRVLQCYCASNISVASQCLLVFFVVFLVFVGVFCGVSGVCWCFAVFCGVSGVCWCFAVFCGVFSLFQLDAQRMLEKSAEIPFQSKPIFPRL